MFDNYDDENDDNDNDNDDNDDDDNDDDNDDDDDDDDNNDDDDADIQGWKRRLHLQCSQRCRSSCPCYHYSHCPL